MSLAFLYGALCLPALLLLAVGLFLPLASILLLAFRSGGWSEGFGGIFFHVLGFTYAQATLSALLSAVVGTLGALIVAEQEPWEGPILWRGSGVLFALPSIVVVLALAGAWGNLGYAWYGWPAILLAHVFFNFPIFLKYVGNALREIDREPEMAALSLGAGRGAVFCRITWPKIRSAFASAFLLAFLYSAGSFLIVLLLGGGPRFTTLEVAIYQSLVSDFDLTTASRLALVQIAAGAAVYLILARGTRPRAAVRRVVLPLYRFRSARANLCLRIGYALGLLAITGLPLLSLFGGAVLRIGRVDWSLLGASAATSAAIAALAGAIAVATAIALAGLARHTGSRALAASCAFLATFPLCVSPLMVTLAWRLFYPEWQWRLHGRWQAVAVAQGVIALPLAYRPIADAWARLPEATYQAAASLGAGSGKVLRWIEWPALLRSVRIAFLLVAAFSLGELGVVLVFVDDRLSTVALLIYREMARYRFENAEAAAALLCLGVGISYWFAERESGGWLGQ